MDGGARLLGAQSVADDALERAAEVVDSGPITPPLPAPDQNHWEVQASRNLPENYLPESLEMKTWLVNLSDCYGALQNGLLDYLGPTQARRRYFDDQQWRRETNLNPLMGVILDFIFLEKLGKEPFDLNAMAIPLLRDLGVPSDVGLPVVHEVVMYVTMVIGDIFPEMFFGHDVRISYEIVGNNDLWIATSKDQSE